MTFDAQCRAAGFNSTSREVFQYNAGLTSDTLAIEEIPGGGPNVILSIDELRLTVCAPVPHAPAERSIDLSAACACSRHQAASDAGACGAAKGKFGHFFKPTFRRSCCCMAQSVAY